MRLSSRVGRRRLWPEPAFQAAVVRTCVTTALVADCRARRDRQQCPDGCSHWWTARPTAEPKRARAWDGPPGVCPCVCTPSNRVRRRATWTGRWSCRYDRRAGRCAPVGADCQRDRVPEEEASAAGRHVVGSIPIQRVALRLAHQRVMNTCATNVPGPHAAVLAGEVLELFPVVPSWATCLSVWVRCPTRDSSTSPPSPTGRIADLEIFANSRRSLDALAGSCPADSQSSSSGDTPERGGIPVNSLPQRRISRAGRESNAVLVLLSRALDRGGSWRRNTLPTGDLELCGLSRWTFADRSGGLITFQPARSQRPSDSWPMIRSSGRISLNSVR